MSGNTNQSHAPPCKLCGKDSFYLLLGGNVDGDFCCLEHLVEWVMQYKRSKEPIITLSERWKDLLGV